MPEIIQDHLRYLSFKERSILNENSISVVMGPKKLIILPDLASPKGYAATRKWKGEATQIYRYVLAGKILNHCGNLRLVEIGLTDAGFDDPAAFGLLTKAVNDGTYWQYMQGYFGSEWDRKTNSHIPSRKNELGFLLPQFAYTIRSNPQLIPGAAAIFIENRDLIQRFPKFRLA